MKLNVEADMDNYSFGYPKECTRCESVHILGLRVKPYYRHTSNGENVMLIGQDPTIYNEKIPVEYVLMLNQSSGQITKWLREEVFGLAIYDLYDSLTLYATNLIKCSLKSPPAATKQGKAVIKNCFQNCKYYLIEEVKKFQPGLVLTFGEPAHEMFTSLFDNKNGFSGSMHNDFTGGFSRVRLSNFEFDYSPCLHIKTFRVADVYGERVAKFKKGVADYFSR